MSTFGNRSFVSLTAGQAWAYICSRHLQAANIYSVARTGLVIDLLVHAAPCQGCMGINNCRVRATLSSSVVPAACAIGSYPETRRVWRCICLEAARPFSYRAGCCWFQGLRVAKSAYHGACTGVSKSGHTGDGALSLRAPAALKARLKA